MAIRGSNPYLRFFFNGAETEIGEMPIESVAASGVDGAADITLGAIGLTSAGTVAVTGTATIALGAIGLVASGGFPTVAGRGPDPVATLVLDIAHEGETVYSFATEIIRSLNGSETRTSLRGCPRETYSFDATLTDASIAALTARIAFSGAQGAVFGVALTYEALTLTVDTNTTNVTVGDTTKSDWMYAGARAVVVRRDGTARHSCVVQSATPTIITVDPAVPANVGLAGSIIMPVIPCYLEAQQDVGGYTNNAGEAVLRARAITFGNATSDWAPAGGPVTTYTDPDTAVVYPVWDRRIDTDDGGVAARNIILGSEIIERGGVLQIHAPWAFADLARQARTTIRTDADRQWVKTFIGTVKGRQKVFLLPTWKPDLGTLVGDASTGLLLMQSSLLEAADYANMWSQSNGHMWLQLLKTDGTVHYRKIQDYEDNLDGTQSILVDLPVVGAIAMVSLLEKCRFDIDDFPVKWEGHYGFCEFGARVVQQ